MEGLENLSKIGTDTTVIKTNIKHPTNNSLVWDCFHESHRLQTHLSEECNLPPFIDYTVSAKKLYYKINNTNGADKREKLFCQQLPNFVKCINQVKNTIKKPIDSLTGLGVQFALKRLLPLMEQVYDIAYRKEILGETVPNDEKLFSIYELHTDIIVKGSRDVKFGHKIELTKGRSSLILDCKIHKGNPADVKLFPDTVDRVIGNYEKVPRDAATDGGFASKPNLEYGLKAGIKNIVFTKVKGSLQNVCSSKHLETKLKKWRSGIEAVISNLKRGFDLRVCTWKGWEHFQAKVMWSVIAYNFRVITALIMQRL